jgi:hypothetical protein
MAVTYTSVKYTVAATTTGNVWFGGDNAGGGGGLTMEIDAVSTGTNTGNGDYNNTYYTEAQALAIIDAWRTFLATPGIGGTITGVDKISDSYTDAVENTSTNPPTFD